MKISILFLITLLLCNFNSSFSKVKTLFPRLYYKINQIPDILSQISQPFSEIIHEMFVKDEIHFDIIIYGSWTRKMMDLLNEITKRNQGNFAEKVRSVNPAFWDHNLNNSAVIFLNYFEDLLKFNKNANLTNEFHKPLRFLVYCEYFDEINAGLNYYMKIERPDGDSRHIGYFENFFVIFPNEFVLFRYEWYTATECNKMRLVEQNTFNPFSMTWSKKLKIEEKFKNFHNCMLTINLVDNHMFTTMDIHGNMHGVPVDFFNAMSRKGNFIPYFQQIERIEDEHGHEISISPIGDYYQDPQVYFIIPYVTQTEHYKHGHFLPYFMEERISFLLATPEPYSAYEKLLLPFDDTTWIFFIAVFIYSFLTILVINLVSRKFQDMFYGKNVNTPVFNVVGTFFGISQTKLPDANFPRILLMTFILYCLVLRTAYQGVLFEYVATDMRRPYPTTIDELYEKNYIIYAKLDSITRLNAMISGPKRFELRKFKFKFILIHFFLQTKHSARIYKRLL